jgi:uncharacterized protein (DUF2147 family)
MAGPRESARHGATLARVVGRLQIRGLALLAGLALAMPVAAQMERAGGDDIRGLWADHRDPEKRKVAVWIEDCDGLLCGHIYWLKKPLSSAGRPKRDQHNPDARLRDRALCGLRILNGFRRTEARVWSVGQIYNPNDGRAFSSTMTLENDGALRIRGYVGLSLFGKTVEWVRPQEKPVRCG